MKKFYLFFFIIFFVACNKTTTALNHFDNNIKEANAIQYTKKADLIDKNGINALFFATYLNKIDKVYSSDKLNSFIIGFHRVNKYEHEIFQNAYILTLNDNKPISMQEIDVNKNDFSKFISLKNPWAKYYLVDFENEKNSKNLTLKLSHSLFGSIQLDFQK